jgi:hypothetical protein
MEFNFPLLNADQIEVKVKQVTNRGAILLLYKTARVDMELLDAIVGPMRWAVDYREVKGNLYCGIGITEDGDRWVWKWDCGIESRADGDGNEKKGEASDAFKRAGFKWGIGRELYTSPFTFAKVETVPSEKGRGYELKDKYMRFYVDDIGYDGRAISRLVIVDGDGNTVFAYGTRRPATTSRQAAQEVGQQKLKEIENKIAENAATEQPITTCERCQKPITGWVDANGHTYTATAIIKRAQERYGGCYCATCMTELAGKRKVV